MIDKDLNIYDSVCTGCSACTEACHFPDENNVNPIELTINKEGLWVPRIDPDICTSCMKCYKACPTEDKLYNNQVTFENYGDHVIKSYYGYSLDKNHRYQAASAGVATEIAYELLKTKQVDGVVSSYQNDKNEIITEIITDPDRVKETKGSIYRQVALLNGLAEKIKNGGHKKLLLIGLSCHIEGLNTLQKADKSLRNIDFITISLFCKQTKTEQFSELERHILNGKANSKINYRGEGWPGITKVEGGNSLPSSNIKFGLMWSTYAFAPEYCFSCSDPLGLNADIAIGDAWLKKYLDDKMGSSLIVSCSKRGDDILHSISSIYLEEEEFNNVINSQNRSYVKLKTNYLDFNIPKDLQKVHSHKAPIKYKIFYFILKANKKIVENTIFTKRTIVYIPNIFLKVYAKLFRSIGNLLLK